MKSLRIGFALMTFSAFMTAEARMVLRCDDGVGLEACADKVEQTLAEIGCTIDSRDTDCFFGLIDDPNSDEPDVNIPTDTPLCEVKSSNCSHARDKLFTVRESCGGAEEKLMIPRNSGVTNNYWKGLWGSYSRVVCKSGR